MAGPKRRRPQKKPALGPRGEGVLSAGVMASSSAPPWTPDRTIALIGLMGAGKSSVGKRLAGALNLPFKDADGEIEAAAGQSVSDIFATLGEPAFRDGERRVIARLLAGPTHVLATGGGAFMQAETRDLLRRDTVIVWLKAEVEVLARRVARKDTRPLLSGKDPVDVLTALAAVRHPVYAQADIVVETGDGSHQQSVDRVLAALTTHHLAGDPMESFAR